MNTNAETMLCKLSHTWWRKICGLQLDLGSTDGNFEEGTKLACAGIECFLGLRPLCIPRHYYRVSEHPFGSFPPVPDFVVSQCISHALSGMVFSPSGIVAAGRLHETPEYTSEQWWDEFLWLVDVHPMSIASVSMTRPGLDQFFSSVQLRRKIESIPRVERFGELPEYLPHHRVTIGTDLRMIDLRVRTLEEKPRMAASFLFDDYLYSSEGVERPSAHYVSLHRVGMLLRLEECLHVELPREPPEALCIEEPLHSMRDIELALKFSSCAPVPARYLDLRGTAGVISGVYLKG